MKTPSKITGHGGEKSRSAVRVHSSAASQKPVPASGQPVPAVRAQNEFSIEEHSRVLREIQERTHRFWFANGSSTSSVQHDWLNAEAETLAEFAEARRQSRPMRPASLFRFASLF
jgi:hypothetical protein